MRPPTRMPVAKDIPARRGCIADACRRRGGKSAQGGKILPSAKPCLLREYSMYPSSEPAASASAPRIRGAKAPQPRHDLRPSDAAQCRQNRAAQLCERVMDDMGSLDGAQPTKHNRGGGVAPPHRGCVVARARPRETEPAGGETIPVSPGTWAGGPGRGSRATPLAARGERQAKP